MAKMSPLHRFPTVRTRDVDEVLAWMRPHLAVEVMDLPARARVSDTILNHRALSSIQLTYVHYGAPISAHLAHVEMFTQGFPLRGKGRVTCGRREVDVCGGGAGTSLGPGAEAVVNYSDDFEHLVLQMPPASLTRKLAALTDRPIDPPLRLTGSGATDPRRAAAQYRLAGFLAAEMNREDAMLAQPVIAELEQAVLVDYLLATEHNYSHLLRREPRSAAPWQARRAIDYIEAHWDEPITIEALAMVTRTSARSLFYMFQRGYGMSPMLYVKQARLRHAKEMLSQPGPDTTVTSVALLCGFSNLGHFARHYFAAFGEKPYETLSSRR